MFQIFFFIVLALFAVPLRQLKYVCRQRIRQNSERLSPNIRMKVLLSLRIGTEIWFAPERHYKFHPTSKRPHLALSWLKLSVLELFGSWTGGLWSCISHKPVHWSAKAPSFLVLRQMGDMYQVLQLKSQERNTKRLFPVLFLIHNMNITVLRNG